MHHTDSPRQSLPQFVLGDPLLWVCAPDGTVLVARGPGYERLGLDPKRAVGRSLWRMRDLGPDLIEVFLGALNGRSWHGMAEYGGLSWLLDFSPILDDQGQVREVVCMGHVLERVRFDPVEGEPDPPVRVQIWEAAGDNARHCIWSADRFVDRADRDVIALWRLIPREEFEAFRAEDPTRVHLLREFGPPARPPLRLL